MKCLGLSVGPKNQLEGQYRSKIIYVTRGLDILAVKKAQENKFDATEMSVFILTNGDSGVTKLVRIRVERIRRTIKVEEISNKWKESRLKLDGHVGLMRRRLHG